MENIKEYDDNFIMNGGNEELLPIVEAPKDNGYKFANGELVGVYTTSNSRKVLTNIEFTKVFYLRHNDKVTRILKRQGWLL
jgi:hypothetical protein